MRSKNRVVWACACMCLASLFVAGETVTFLPEASTYVHKNEAGALHAGIIVCDVREGVMRLDVGGMANIERAVLRLYVTQHDDADSKPIILRRMNDVDWLESQVTMNALAHEFPNGVTAWTSKDDASVIGYCGKVPGVNQWTEFDITAAVKHEAARSGKLAFVISSMGFYGRLSTCFAAVSRNEPEKSPQFVVTWPDGETRGTSRPWVCCPVTDAFTAENNGSTIRVDESFLAGNGREAYFRFNLADLVGQGQVQVRRAILKFSARGFSNDASKNVYVHSYNDVTWTEADYPVGNRTKNLPNGKTSITTSTTGAVKFGGTWSKTFLNEGDITSLVQAAVANGRDKLTLGLITTENFAIGASHRNPTNQPPQIWVDLAPRATPDWAYYPQESRTALHYARVNNWSDKNGNGNSHNETSETIQVGSLDSGTTKRALNAFLLFDATGLEHAPYVRLRLRVQNANDQNPGRRIFGCATPYWDCKRLTWSNMITDFDGSCIEVVASGKEDYPNHLSAIYHQIGSMSFNPLFIEADVTSVVRSAARTGQYVTFMLGATDNTGWTFYYNEKVTTAAYRPQLVYPAIRGFANNLTATTGTALDGHATAEISWTPSTVADTTYSVTRRELENEKTETLVTGLASASFSDTKARSDRAYIYTVTAICPDGTVETASFTNRIDTTVTVTNVLDGYVRNGAYKADAANWLARSIVMKDGGSNDNAGTREGFMRFALADVPGNMTRVTLRLRVGAIGDFDGDETVYFRTVPDIDKTDADPPTWNDLLGSATGGTAVNVEGVFHGRVLATDPLPTFGFFDVDVTEQVQAAKNGGASHILFHSFVDDPDHALNFGYATKESPYVSSAPQLICERKSWAPGGMVILVR